MHSGIHTSKANCTLYLLEKYGIRYEETVEASYIRCCSVCPDGTVFCNAFTGSEVGVMASIARYGHILSAREWAQKAKESA